MFHCSLHPPNTRQSSRQFQLSSNLCSIDFIQFAHKPFELWSKKNKEKTNKKNGKWISHFNQIEIMLSSTNRILEKYFTIDNELIVGINSFVRTAISLYFKVHLHGFVDGVWVKWQEWTNAHDHFMVAFCYLLNWTVWLMVRATITFWNVPLSWITLIKTYRFPYV